MSNNNIYQVLKESDLDEILSDYAQHIVIVMFSSKTCIPCMKIKPRFITMSNEHPDCFFVYIDIDNFDDKTSKYLGTIQSTPKFSYFFNKQEIAYVLGVNEEAINGTLIHLKDKIESKRKEYIEIEQQKQQHQQYQQQNNFHQYTNDDQIISMKLDMLKKIYELQKAGFKITKKYGLDDSLEDMINEYEFHQNQNHKSSQIKEQIQQNPQSNSIIDVVDNQVQIQVPSIDYSQLEMIKKQEQIKKIQELQRLNQIMQMQQLYRLQQQQQQQLKQLHKFKESKEQNKQNENEQNEQIEGKENKNK